MQSGEQIQKALRKFSKKWGPFKGSERAEAQTFLNQLFECYGSDRGDVGAKFEDFKSSAGFMDLHWPGVCIVEMKAPHVPVSAARDQVKRYWEESADEVEDRPAARWVVICNFQQFEVWEPGRFPKSPRATFSLADLPNRYEALMFLTGPEQVPSFLEHHKQLTTEAAGVVGDVYQSLVDRGAAPSDEIIRFTLQSVWTMFAEDLGLLHGSPYQTTIEQLRKRPEDSAAKLGFLFRVLNQKGNHNRKGLYAGTRYVNGQLFEDPAEIELTKTELDALATAAQYDWSKVEPTIFGSLMERVIAGKLGAHYTHEADIMKIVGPTIVRPWTDRLAAATTPHEALTILEELCAYRVADTSCGCGNFLYVAYREMRQLEYLAKQRISGLAASTGLPAPEGPFPYVPLTNFYGTDIEPAAVLIARVTLWMGHRQMIDRYGEAETPLPLVSLAGIRVGDAVFGAWPDADCYIGNPPFLGDRKIRGEHGDAYIERLKKEFPGIGVVDYSAYWFRLAHNKMKDGQRAGLVSTNTLRQNKHRLASLLYIINNGGIITDAVSSQKWPGEAKVHVSITNWVKNPTPAPTEFMLDGVQVETINSKLKPEAAEPEPYRLPANKNHAFIGCQPTGTGFIVSDAIAKRLHDVGEESVVRRYLDSDDLADAVGAVPRRWIIDFGTMPLEGAKKYPGSLKILRREVKPGREDNPDLHRYWWRFWRPRPEMRNALEGLDRYIVSTLTGKRLLLAWAEPDWCPSNAVGVFALDDDYSMGVLASNAFDAWAWGESSTLKDDLRLTPSTVFETFPWPASTQGQRAAVAEASRALFARRHEIVVAEQIGLTELYNLVDDGAYTDLLGLHRFLDEAVAACYGWSRPTAHDRSEILKRLGDMNQKIGSGAGRYAPFEPS